MAVLLGAIKSINFGNFPKTSVGKRSWLIANYVQGSGFRGESLRDIRDYLKRQTNSNITKESIFASLRMLYKFGYSFKDKKNWLDTIVFENKKFNK
jgi:hypothetical protein